MWINNNRYTFKSFNIYNKRKVQYNKILTLICKKLKKKSLKLIFNFTKSLSYNIYVYVFIYTNDTIKSEYIKKSFVSKWYIIFFSDFAYLKKKDTILEYYLFLSNYSNIFLTFSMVGDKI